MFTAKCKPHAKPTGNTQAAKQPNEEVGSTSDTQPPSQASKRPRRENLTMYLAYLVQSTLPYSALQRAPLWRSKWCKNPRAQNEGSAHKSMGSAHKSSDRAHKSSDRAHKTTSSAHKNYLREQKRLTCKRAQNTCMRLRIFDV